ncbi:MAG: response regulator [Betaproteobacteria bacterium]|nr:response regulator [Betaproteobacteria bacterium]
MVSKAYLTPNQAASLLMVSPATLRVWTEKGLLKAQVTAGGHRRFLAAELERFQRELQPGRVVAGEGGETGAEGERRILIVDDDAALTRYLSALLGTREGVTVVAAQDGFMAGQLVHTFRPDTLLLDLMMPGLDGFSVCRQIKADPATRHLRVIAITGYPSPENVDRILEVGGDACLSKPLDEALLLARLGLDGEVL